MVTMDTAFGGFAWFPESSRCGGIIGNTAAEHAMQPGLYIFRKSIVGLARPDCGATGVQVGSSIACRRDSNLELLRIRRMDRFLVGTILHYKATKN